jgi:hypothetical protein
MVHTLSFTRTRGRPFRSNTIYQNTFSAAMEASAVPPIMRCERCGRYCMSLELHQVLCAEEPETKKGDSRRRAPLPVLPRENEPQHEWEEVPCTANWLREEIEDHRRPQESMIHVPCPTCGRRFVQARLGIHRRACAGQALPGFRAVVHALDANEREEELVLNERLQGETRIAEEVRKTEEQRARAEAAEAEAAAAKAELQLVLSRVERAEAAAKSMEAAYDVRVYAWIEPATFGRPLLIAFPRPSVRPAYR